MKEVLGEARNDARIKEIGPEMREKKRNQLREEEHMGCGCAR